MNHYKFVIEFESKDQITGKQLDDLEYSLWAQISDPHENDDDYGWSSAGYETGEIHITRNLIAGRQFDAVGSPVTVCNYCGGQFVDPAEVAEYCPDCVTAHENRACETAGHCEICDTDTDGWVCTPDKEISFEHCGRPAYWEGEDVFCNKCNEKLTDTGHTDPDGFLCVDCVFHSEGVAESDAPTHNDKGTRFLQNLDDQNMTAVLAGEPDVFSWAHCVGCLTTLAGYRFPVVLFDNKTDK